MMRTTPVDEEDWLDEDDLRRASRSPKDFERYAISVRDE
jgi:hypothetical protein